MANRHLHARLGFVIFMVISVTVLVVVYTTSLNTSDDASIYSYRLKLDTAAAPNETEIHAKIAREIPSLPLEQLLEFPRLGYGFNESCASYPGLYDIKYYNNYWQLFEQSDATLRLFGAYYDKRPAVPNAPLVRLLAMINASEYKSNSTFCQIWFVEQKEPVIVPASNFLMIWYKAWGNTPKHVYPHLLSCNIPDDHKHLIPLTVSLVRSPCESATNNLKVYYEPPAEGAPEHHGFAVCVKALIFPYVDLSARLVEWIEVQRQLGARRITIHNMQLHPNIVRVLEYYHSTGFVDFRPYAFGRGEPNVADFGSLVTEIDNHNRILHEVIPYNDCFYRNMYKYEFISAQDIDEVIMPLGNLTDWHKLFDVVRDMPDPNCNIHRYSSYCFRNVYFPRYPEKNANFAELPEFFYMLQHVERVREHLDPILATKCFHSAKYAVGLHNHFPLHWVDSCNPFSVNVSLAQMQHYREPDIKETLNEPVYDDNIWRFKDEIVNRTLTVLEKLNLLERVRISYLLGNEA